MFADATKTYPSDANLSQMESGTSSLFGSNQSASSITFTVPEGEYSFQRYPNSLEVFTGPLDQPVKGSNGEIRVAGSNLEFCVADVTAVG